ncbi:MAG: hypothetical protein MUE53_08780 [Chitinophagales bacterium]|jgi:hypothetical protein|nr:hypothetical protein [Chitinophagales bacterium]
MDITKPQFNFKLGYFITKSLALVLAQDHMKYVMLQNQVIDYTGYKSDQKFASMIRNSQIDVTNGDFLIYEHTDGLNYVNLGMEKYYSLIE